VTALGVAWILDGALGPDIYGSLVNSHRGLFIAYLVGAGIMVLRGLAEVFLGVDAERKSLELIATPLSAIGVTGGPVTAGARPGFAHAAPPMHMPMPRPESLRRQVIRGARSTWTPKPG